MQGLFTYIYHIVLIITYVRTIEICTHTYKTTGKVWVTHGKWMFVFLLIESIGSFDLDIGYIGDAPIVMGSLLVLIKITIDFALYSFLNHLISDYLELPRDDVPYIILGFLYAISAMLVLLSAYRPFLSMGQSFMCLGPVVTSVRILNAVHREEIKLENRIRNMLIMAVVFMILISIQNLVAFYVNDNGWLGLRYKVSPVDDIFALCLAFTLQHLDREAGVEVEAAEERNKMRGFCSHYSMTGRESEITDLILKGKSNQEISDELFISIGTVKHHIYNIYTKLGVERRSQLMKTYLEFGKETQEHDKSNI